MSVVILPKEMSKTDMEILMEFVYLGSVSIPPERLASVKRAAEILQIRGISDLDFLDTRYAHKTAHFTAKKIDNSGVCFFENFHGSSYINLL